MTRPLAVYTAQRDLAVLMGQDPLAPTGTFYVRSKSRQGVGYEMQHTPDGYAVHQGEGCEGEIFNGPLGCWHSKSYSVNREEIEDMTSMVPYQAGAVAEVRQFTEEDVATLKQTICKGATDSELKLFIATCQHTGLDPFMRQIHAVKRWDSTEKREVMAIQVGIDGYRLTARRTGEMQGMDGPQWTYDGKTWVDLPQENAIPLAARVGVWRKGSERPYVAIARWSAYVQTTREGKPNSMWTRMGPEQLAKCAEALALRRAFPAELAALPQHVEYDDSTDYGDDWTPEQVRDRYIESTGTGVEHRETPVSASDGPGGAVPAADATSPASSDEPEFDDELTARPEEPEPDEAPADATATKQAIIRALEDCKQTWDAPAYMTLFKDLSQFIPDGKRFAIDALPDDKAVECLAFVRERRGEPVPA